MLAQRSAVLGNVSVTHFIYFILSFDEFRVAEFAVIGAAAAATNLFCNNMTALGVEPNEKHISWMDREQNLAVKQQLSFICD